MANESQDQEVKQNSFTIETAGDQAKAIEAKQVEAQEALKTDTAKEEVKTDVKSEEADEKVESKNDTTQDEGGTEKKPKKSRAQKRIENLSKEKRELAQRVAELENERDGKKSDDAAVELDPDAYDNYDDYLDALDAQDDKTPEVKQDKTNATDVDFQAVLDDIEVKFDNVRDKYEDFDELVQKEPKDGGPAISREMLETINEVENSGEVAYALAKDVSNSFRIANLKPIKQALEIEKLSRKLAKEIKSSPNEDTTKKATKAPEPINALGGGEVPVTGLKEAANYKDYQAMRKKQTSGRNGW